MFYTVTMRKTFLFIMVTLDGYYEGKEHDISWHNTDEEFTKFANEQLDKSDTLIFGRKTYEVMADFWPTPHAFEAERDTAVRMNAHRKIVFSHELFDVDWENTEVSTNLIEKIKELKEQDGKDIAVMGSSHLGKELLEAGLVDEVRIMVNPVFIRSGSTLFEGLSKKLTLNSTQTFKNGNVLLVYSV